MVRPQLDTVLRQLRLRSDPRAAGASDAELLTRFAARRDEDAFAALLARHGPMVLGVGRRVLGRDHDAEDVFQAAFLLLARKAGSVRKPESVACWLHGVARRLAVKLKAQVARRQAREKQAADMRRTAAGAPAAWQELQAVLDDALRQVPGKYRSALVLCYLEGKTQEEAARQLGCRVGTVKSWLARGRKLLQDRLARRGVALSAGALATALAASSAPAAVPAALLAPTFRAALRVAAGAAAAEVVSPHVAALVQNGLKFLLTARLRALALLGFALVLLGSGAGVLAYRAATPGPPDEREARGPENGTQEGAPRPAPRAPRPPDDVPPPGALARLGATTFRHADLVERVAFSPDGKALATWSGRTFWLWETDTGRLARRVPLHQADLRCLAFFPDGRSLAVLDSGEDRLHLWDFASREEPPAGIARRCPAWPTCCAVSADGKVLALGGARPGEETGTIRVYRVEAGEELRRLEEVCRFPCPPGTGRWLVLSPDGGRLLSAGAAPQRAAEGGPVPGRADEAVLWDVAAGKELYRLPVPAAPLYASPVPAVFSPDGRTLALAARDRTIRLWDVAAGREHLRLATQPGAVVCLAFSPDGKTLASGGPGPAIRFWDASDGRPVGEAKSKAGTVTSLTFSPDGRALASSALNRVCLWDVASGAEAFAEVGHESVVVALALADDGRTAATADGNGVLRLWEAETGRELRRLAADAGRSCALAFPPGGRTVAWANGAAFRLWDVATGEELQRRNLGPGAGPARAWAFSPDGRVLAAAGPNQALRLWDVAAGRALAEIPAGPAAVSALAFSPDGRVLATAAGRTELRGPGNVAISLWDVATGRNARRFDVPFGKVGTNCWISALAFSPDGTSVASASESNAVWLGPIPRTAGLPDRGNPVRLWDAGTGREVRPFPAEPGHALLDHGGAGCVAFSPDGKTVAAGEWDGTVVLHDAETGAVRGRLEGHRGPVRSVVFSADGRRLASSSADLTALVWDLTEKPRPKGR